MSQTDLNMWRRRTMEIVKPGNKFVVRSELLHAPWEVEELQIEIERINSNEGDEFLKCYCKDGREWIFHHHLKDTQRYYLPWAYMRDGDRDLLIIGDLLDDQGLLEKTMTHDMVQLRRVKRDGMYMFYAWDPNVGDLGEHTQYYDTQDQCAWGFLSEADCCGSGCCGNGPAILPTIFRRNENVEA